MKNKTYYLKYLFLCFPFFLLFSCQKEGVDIEKAPLISSISPLEAGKDDTLSIFGTNLLATDADPEISVNGTPLTVIKATNDTVLLRIPKLLGSGKLVLTAGGKTYDGPEFTYKYRTKVSTVAGTGAVGKTDGKGSQATFNNPWGIAAAPNGDLYIADSYNRLIRKVCADKTVSTIQIELMPGGGQFYSPYNLALDGNGDLYVTDFNDHVLKISAQGVQSVIYNGRGPTTGIAIGPDGYLYMSINNDGNILRLRKDGSDVQQFASGIRTPRNIVFDRSGTMFVAGYDTQSLSAGIFKVDQSGATSLVAKDKEFGGWEIVVDALGNFFQADHFNNCIRIIEKSGRTVTIAGNGIAADVDGTGPAASFDGPNGLTIDADGNLFVTTYNSATKTGNRVRKIVVE
jgi:sugar lactone lactonase YvrE